MRAPAFDVGAVACSPPVWTQVNRDMICDEWATLKTAAVSLMFPSASALTSAGSISLVLSSIKSSKSLSKAFLSWCGITETFFSKSNAIKQTV